MNDTNGSDKSMALHPISVVAERTGLTADLLRMWERRYGVVVPERDDAGRRLYRDADVERLRLLAQATSAGRSVGQLVALTTEQLQEVVRSDESARWTAVRPPELAAGEQEFIARALERTRALDAAGLERELRRAAAIFGAARFLEGVVAPLFTRIGEAWHAGQMSIGQEHLASATVRPLISELRAALPAGPDAPVVLVATPAGERHEIGALLVSAAAAVEGWRVTYLGPDVPADDIAAAAAETGARVVALSAVYTASSAELAREITRLRELLPNDVAILVGGAAAVRLNGQVDRERISLVGDLEEWRAYLRS
jgi:MerR family transcriptional regulator, light-induced transcriptional regulator